MAHEPKISVVVPVYNEHDNIGACLRGLWGALSAVPHEILVCYDFDEDTTLGAIAKMTDQPPTLRLVKNTIGRGAANALRAGFAAAAGDVVVTTMADLSDPPQDILRMAELMRRENLSVVAGSRYMRGGKQIGGPLLKRTLSRLGGVSLRWLAGLGTSDATSNFRGYSKRFLDEVHIESKTGFQIALELTVKAHLAGLGVGEVPTTWTDRTAGESRFRLWKWLPDYARWWFRAAWQPIVVGIVWLAMTVGALSYVHRYAARTPIQDDLELVPFIGPDYHWTLDELWSQHNEHRLPLPRRLETALFEATGDVRSLMFAEVALLSGLALGTLLVVRRMRGRTWLADAVFPLLWLHTGNCENLLMGFQIALVLPTIFVCTILLVALRRSRQGLTPAESVLCGACLLALPLCGGLGFVQVPALFAGLALAAWISWRRPDQAYRRGAVLLAAFLALTVALAVLYLVDFRFPEHAQRTRDPALIGGAALRTLSLALGEAGKTWWPWSGIGIALLLVATLVLACRAWSRLPGERFRIGAVIIGIGTSVSLALLIAFGRAGAGVESGFAMRYIPLVSPMILAVVCAWSLYGTKHSRWAVPGALALALVAAHAFVNIPRGAAYGRARADVERELDRDIRDGMEPRAFVEKWAGRIYPDRHRLYGILSQLAILRLAPFDTAPERVRERYTWTIFSLKPTRIDSPAAPTEWYVDGYWPVLLVPGGCTIHFDVPAGRTKLTGSFGMLDAAIARGKAPGARAVIRVDESGSKALLDRTIDPVNAPGDRGAQGFTVELPPGPSRIVLEMHVPPEAVREARWAYWGDLEFD